MTEAVQNTRALLRLFEQTRCRDLHVRIEGYALFIARPDGSANPMQFAAAAVDTISAPHIATFVSALPVGTLVAAGDVIAKLDLLGEEVVVEAQKSGRIHALLAEPGQLLEYEMPILTVSAA